jgi:hypothetical protein
VCDDLGALSANSCSLRHCSSRPRGKQRLPRR